MTESMQKIVAGVSKRVTPTQADRRRVKLLLNKLIAKAREEAKARGIQARVEIEGSIAKDTWIAGDRDIDVFLIFPTGTESGKVKGEGLELAKAAAGSKWSLGYAEHPYVEAQIDGFTLDIVPSQEMREGEKPTTSVDRTPLHTRFIEERLDSSGRTEVRVLKQFLKGIGVYGAELKVGGFSGYLAELLVVRFGTFEGVVRAAAGWRERTIINIAGHYPEGGLEDIFEGNLVMVDPVDRSRNAAAAVSTQSYFTFIAASRQFLEKPSLGFFFPREARAGSSAVVGEIAKKGSHVVAVVVPCPSVPSDILWGEAYRAMRRVAGVLTEGGFAINDCAAWSDEEKTLVLLYELHELEISKWRLHLGPMVTLKEEAQSFLRKYRGARGVLAGPYIREDRWAVELQREHASAASLLRAKLGGVRFSTDLDKAFKKGYKVLCDDQLRKLMESRQGLAAFVLKWLRKKIPWLNS